MYEDGSPQPLFGFFPIAASAATEPWDFRLFGKNWRGEVWSMPTDRARRRMRTDHAVGACRWIVPTEDADGAC